MSITYNTQKLDKFELRLEQNTIDQEKISGQCTLGANAFFCQQRREHKAPMVSDQVNKQFHFQARV